VSTTSVADVTAGNPTRARDEADRNPNRDITVALYGAI
jgi:hypothetical protein